MEYGLLIGVIIFLAVAGFYGYARGMVKILLSMIAMIVTIILTTILAVPVGKIVKEVTPIYDNMYETVEESVKEYNIIDVSSVNKLDLPKQIKEKITDTEEIIDNYEKFVATEITDTAFNAVVYLVLLVVIYIIVKIVITMLDFVAPAGVPAARLQHPDRRHHARGILYGHRHGDLAHDTLGQNRIRPRLRSADHPDPQLRRLSRRRFVRHFDHERVCAAHQPRFQAPTLRLLRLWKRKLQPSGTWW